jgi:hypothetical protein
VEAPGVTADLFSRGGYGYRVGVRPPLIEILTAIDGVEFDEAIEDPRFFEIDGRSMPYIGRAALLKNKRAAGRAKDLDVSNHPRPRHQARRPPRQ